MSEEKIIELELGLDSFDASVRRDALRELVEMVGAGEIELGEVGSDVNLHIHSFYSYNACGYSPSKIAWLARRRGLGVVGIVDFDVFDGLEEFLGASRMVGVKGCVGVESRVYVPEFADKEINSPGEPGVSYHIGVGLTSCDAAGRMLDFKNTLRRIPDERNRELVGRVNEFLRPVVLDYDRDVLPLTPSGNATERHICLAYARKAAGVFGDSSELKEFWSDKLGSVDFEVPEGADLQALIRAKTMKRGGVGYVQPGEGAFETMAEMNGFILAMGGIPTLGWLSGFSDGEREIEKLLEVAMASGTGAINLIPDRNYTAGVKDEGLGNLNRIVEIATGLDLPIVVGTEMNSPGLKFVDDFNSAELGPHAATFLKGAHIVYGHSVMQGQCGMGYMSKWADECFKTRGAKNDFYETVGSNIRVSEEDLLGEFKNLSGVRPEEILTGVCHCEDEGGRINS